jgi:xanthine dehydrogenase YagS FAD-binding subunit
MRAFTNSNARDVKDALTLLSRNRAVAAGGGSDLLALMKERIVSPDVLVNLKSIKSLDEVTAERSGVRIGGLITLDRLSKHDTIRRQYAVLAQAAESIATPQIRNVATLAGNVCQRPWCWYFRNGFTCYKNGGNTCYSAAGENQFHAIFGGGPSYIVHPSDSAPALVALDAAFRIAGASGERTIPAAEFFALPAANPAAENVLANGELLTGFLLPRPRAGVRSAYHKVLDREAWTHAIVSAAVVLEMDKDICRSARIVLGGVAPIPWRLPRVEAMLAGQRITEELAAKAGEAAVEGARPLSKNAYKVPLTKAVVKRTLLELTAARS